MKHLLFIAFIFSALLNFAQEPGRAQFDSLLTRAKIDFSMPTGCEEVDVDFMHKIPHNFAVAPKNGHYQIRYWVRPLDSWFETFNKKSDQEKKRSMHPDKLCESMMMLAVLDASNNATRDFQPSQYQELTKQAYNADWQAVAMFESGWPDEGFKYCYIKCLHKDGVADIYQYILADKKKDFIKIMDATAKSIKFQ